MTGILGLDAATNQAICAVFPKKELLERDYVYWFFRKMRPDYLKNSFGGAQPNISQKMIRETEIPIPSLPEQRRIVAYLDALQAKVDALGRLSRQRPVPN
jgi:type I restriction enzyme S subunit